ncbi:diguanylate cyclase [Salinisphaera sp. C84B14]|uniref:GGDEF domain-containing protein n=1 Tax=Salinisphaera sp. C84B14 TaxID=1304155 RepID=UPI00333F77C2
MAARNFNTSVHRSQLLGQAHGAPRQVERSFWRLLFRTSVMAGVTHVLFVALFYELDVKPLAIINIGSSALYLLICLLMLRLRTRFLALGLFVFEFQAHALLAAYLIGWDSGFHYYALLTIPLITLAYFRDKRMKGVAIFLVIALMVVTDALSRGAAPAYVLPRSVVDALHYANLIANLTILAVIVAFYFGLITRTEDKLRKLATTDPLTHLLNRRSMLEIWNLECATQRRSGNPMSVILCDIDHFKRINDRYGHDVGDQVLRVVSETLASKTRQSDHVARWGGEEFLVLMVGTPIDKAEQLAEHLRQTVSHLDVCIDPENDVQLTVTLTFGVTDMPPHQLDSQEAAITRADVALYAGKHAGRNCVRCQAYDAPLTRHSAA